jgi:hypothetical protein
VSTKRVNKSSRRVLRCSVRRFVCLACRRPDFSRMPDNFLHSPVYGTYDVIG